MTGDGPAPTTDGEVDAVPRGIDGGLVEIRVQGIGNLPWTDALGRPQNLVVRRRVRLLDPPTMPAHRVRIVNWVRGTRSAQRAGWYLAFPFTLVNVTAFLHPASRRSRWLSTGTHLVAALLTVGTVVWGVATVETVLLRLPVTLHPAAASWWVTLPVAVLFAGAIVLRSMLARPAVGDAEGRQAARPVVAGAHAALAVGLGVALAITRPARWPAAGWPVSPTRVGSRTGTGASPGPEITLLDPVPAFAAASVALAVAVAVVLVVRAAIDQRRWSRDGRPGAPSGPIGLNLSGAGLVLVASVVVLHALFALLRMAVDSAASLVATAFAPGTRSSGTWVGTVLAADDPTTYQDNRLDFLPAHAVLLLAVLGASVLGVAWVRTRRHPEPPRTPLAWRELARRSVGDAAGILWRGLTVAGVVGGAVSVAGVAFLESRRAEPVFPVLYLLISILATLASVTVLLAQFAGVREAISRVGDVIGFWPVRAHPLAGSCYRGDVVAALRAELATHRGRPVLLVGHSQGSLLVLWLLVHGPGDGSEVAKPFLLTTASPVHTLFRGLFPAQLGEWFAPDAAARVAGWWNAWRYTDPVSGPMPCADDLRLDDPRPSESVRGHGGYWDDPVLAALIRRIAAGDPPGGGAGRRDD